MGRPHAQSAGVTYRQLNYWARTGLVEPSVRATHGSGSQRLQLPHARPRPRSPWSGPPRRVLTSWSVQHPYEPRRHDQLGDDQR